MSEKNVEELEKKKRLDNAIKIVAESLEKNIQNEREAYERIKRLKEKRNI